MITHANNPVPVPTLLDEDHPCRSTNLYNVTYNQSYQKYHTRGPIYLGSGCIGIRVEPGTTFSVKLLKRWVVDDANGSQDSNNKKEG